MPFSVKAPSREETGVVPPSLSGEPLVGGELDLDKMADRIGEEDPYAKYMAGPGGEEPTNSALQDALNTIAANERKAGKAAKLALDFGEQPQQPYITESSAFKATMNARLVQLNAEIGQLEGVRDGINARIDDMHATRNAVKASLDMLK